METGYLIYHPNYPNQKFLFENSMGSNDIIGETINKHRTQLETFGSRPYVYYAGNSNYLTYEISHVFVPEKDDYDRVTKTSLMVANEFRKLVDLNEGMIVERLGEKRYFDVEITYFGVPKLFVVDDMDYIQVTIKLVEIDEI